MQPIRSTQTCNSTALASRQSRGDALRIRSTLVRALLVAGLFGVAHVAFAQALNPAGNEEIRRIEERNARDRARLEARKDAIPQSDDTAALAKEFPSETPCFQIGAIKLEGDPSAAFGFLQPVADGYVGKCVGAQGIQYVLKHLTAGLISAGYTTTRVLVPEQDLGSGTLRLTVVPGVIRDVQFSGDSEHASWKSALPVHTGEILNLRDIEQGLEQFKRVPSQDVEIDIAPGRELGESDLIIKRTRSKPWRLALSAADAGTEATGKLQGAVALAIDNPLGVNDLLNISVNHDLDQQATDHGTRGASIFYSIPFGYWTFNVAANQGQFRQTVVGANQTFQSSGNSEGAEVGVSRIIHRSQASRTGIAFRLSKKSSDNFIDDTEIEVQRRRITAAEVALDHRHYWGAAILDGSIGLRKGVSWFGAQAEADNAQPDTPTPRYEIWFADASISRPLSFGPVKVWYTGRWHIQHNRTALFGAEFFSIGNRYTVRGFDGEHSLAGERGWFIRNELALPFTFPGTQAQQQFYVGVDHGEVGGAATEALAGRRLTGTALGLRGGAKGFNYDVSLGWALHKPDGFATEQAALAVQVGYQF